MCYNLYIATSLKLNPTKWIENETYFNLDVVENEYLSLVKSKFTLPNIIYVGAWEGCSCGFGYGDENDDISEWDEHDFKCKRSTEEIFANLRNYLKEMPFLELYYCWQGDEQKPIQNKMDLFLGNFVLPELYYEIPARTLITVKYSSV